MTESQPTSPKRAESKTSGPAIAGLICGGGAVFLALSGIYTLGIGGAMGLLIGIVGLIFSIVALRGIRRTPGQLTGRGLAIAGLATSIAAVVLGAVVTAIMGGIMIFALTEARPEAEQVQCMNNVHQLGVAIAGYSADNKGRLPPPDSWPEAIKSHLDDETILAEPGAADQGRAYAMNAALAGKRMEDIRRPSQTVMIFECAPGAPPAGGADSLPPKPHHPRGYVIGFCDGHVEVIAKNDLDRLIWDPKAE
jgi:prepilin-type processing-associated H-X9-DG protein